MLKHSSPKRRPNAYAAILLLLLFMLLNQTLWAQGVKGSIINSKGEPLPFASIYIASINSGVTSNINGQFEIKLPPGKHSLQVQHIGYQIQKLEIEVSSKWVERDFILQEQAVVLKEVQVKSKAEDPAYTIMRKAIAKKRFHRMQYKSYTVKVYIKGTGELKKAPFFLKGKIKEEGVKLNEAYTSEKVSEIRFEQPDKVEEKVLSIRASGEHNNTPAPTIFIHQGFYKETVGDILSPLASSAFSYYKFRYIGSFREGDIAVNKIKVSPRSRGEQLFEGYIYIIEDLWAIHSLDLKASHMGIPIHARQHFAEVAPKVWMPVTHQYEIEANALGFEGHYKYMVSCMDYQLELNPDLLVDTEIIDEKIEDVPEDIQIGRPKEKDELADALANEEKMSRKQFRKILKRYEKESRKAQQEPGVIRERSYTIDSLATKKDSAYWAGIRPSPLTAKEIAGYQRDDSLAAVEAARLSGKDSLGVIPKSRFKPQDLLLGGRYNLSPTTKIRLYPSLVGIYFNSVEGLNVNLKTRLRHEYDSLRKRFEFTPTLRYGFSSENLYAKARFQYQIKKEESFNSVFFEGGSFVQQFNAENPIHPHINTLSTLLLRQNFMKIYDKQYVSGGFTLQAAKGLEIGGRLEWAIRNELFNQNDYSFFYSDTRLVQSNRPQNIELENTGFPSHKALLFQANISYRPGLKYMRYNGRKIPLLEEAPELLLHYHKGIPAARPGSLVDFDQLELGINHHFSFGVRGKLDFELRGGTFLNRKSMFFMDYKHFDGNRTILGSIRPAGSFRLLDYYLYSTNGAYFSAQTHYQFRKFLLTQLPELRFSGLRENLFFNYLKTASSPHYYEIGYSVDQIFKMLRLEVAASFHDKHYKELGFRIGVATFLQFREED